MDSVAGAAPEWDSDPRGGKGKSGDPGDTIAAIATAVAPGAGSVAIVRLSGSSSEAIGRRLFTAPGQQV
jgi:hypothetical protein